ncbi:MAG: hypothetical protein K6G64_03445 [Eubacterium sp.]|nr:hypothetical protein [Eubacterium sp.]
MQSRYYDAEVGRFINADDVEELGKTKDIINRHNLYCYCEDNPISYMDPSGRGVLIVLGAITMVAVLSAGCQNKYTPKYNSFADKITTQTSKYNCYAYALNKTQWSVIGQFSGHIVKKMNITNLLGGVMNDLIKLGYCVKTVKVNYKPKIGETMIALRSGKRDYHFMKKVGKKWKHKPGGTAILTLKGKPEDYNPWYSEFYTRQGWGINKAYKYDSKIYYIVYSRH